MPNIIFMHVGDANNGTPEIVAALPGLPDDAERINCPRVGEPGHSQCGVCPTHSVPRMQCACLAPAVRTLQELAAVDPADMTTAELVATWKGETDPETAPMPDGSRRPFNYSTRGASDGPARKYPVNAPAFVLHGERLPATPRAFNAPYLRAIFAPTKADTARLAARPIALVGPARRLTGEYVPAQTAPGRKWGVEAYAYTVDAHRSRVIAAAGALALEIATDWAYEIGKPAAPALEGDNNV